MKSEDPIVDSAIRKALRGRVSRSTGPCPEENGLTAYIENRLGPPEREQMEDHLSSCSSCQEIVSLAIKVEESVIPPVDETFPSPRKTVLFRFSVSFSTLALIVVAVAAGVLFFEMRSSLRKDAPAQMVRVQESERKPPAAPAASSSVEAIDRNFRDNRVKTGAGRDERIFERRNEKQKADDSRVVRKDIPAPTAPAEEALKRAENLDEKRAEQDKLAALGPRQEIPTPKPEPSWVKGQQGADRQAAGVIQTEAREQKLQIAGAPAPAQISAADSAQRQYAVSTPQSVLYAFSQQPLEQTEPAKARLEKNMEAGKIERASGVSYSSAQSSRKVGDRSFYWVSGYWIDSQCRDHPNAPFVEIGETDPVFNEIQKAFPQTAELRSSKAPILLYWKGKNYVVRFRNP